MYVGDGWGRVRGVAQVLGVVVAITAGIDSSQAGPAAARLKIKNGNNITVALDRSRERAVGIRPEKEIWTLVFAGDLAGSTAELQDVTPNVTGSRWTLSLATDRLVLDPPRFLPSHVYRVEVRREKQLLGSAFVYLYPPPPPPSVERLEIGDDKDGKDSKDSKDSDQPESSAPVIPKGGL
jgi:hypothetical protein